MVGGARYSEAFKQDAIALVASAGRSLDSVAKELGVNTETLRKRVRAAEAARAGGDGEPMTPSEREELKRLRKQVCELELEKEILRERFVNPATWRSGNTSRSSAAGHAGDSIRRRRLLKVSAVVEVAALLCCTPSAT
ncbi:transposase [Streptomyces incanus]|uniref:Transposase n=1 Tax=Streptomyces incanus TaxID=887453 RepID=A0ABW0XYA6_9ACTN